MRFHFVRPSPFCACALIYLLMLAFPTMTSAQNLRVGRWQFQFAGPRGVQLAFDGVPIVRQSTLNVVKPGWTGSLFSEAAITHRFRTVAAGDGQVMTVEGDNELFSARYDITLRPDDTATVALSYELRQDVPAEIEYCAGYFNANLIACRRFTADTANGPRQGVVPFLPPTPDQQANELAPDWSRVTFASRLGELTMRVQSDEPRVIFFDARRDPQTWAQDAPIFWLGLGSPARPLVAHRPRHFVLDLRITPDRSTEGPTDSKAAVSQRHGDTQATRTSVRDAVDPRGQAPLVIPRPKEARFGGPACRLTPQFRIVAYGPAAARHGAAALQRELADRWNLRLPVEYHERGGLQTTLLVTRGRREIAPTAADDAIWQHSPEGYSLVVNRNDVRVEASAPAGAFYGAQTVAQLLRHGRHGEVEIAGARVADWPSFPFRGAHLFPSGEDPGFAMKLVDRVLGRYKMNRLVLEVENARWKSHPELNSPQGASTEQLAALAGECGERFVEVIPLVQSLGHAGWMFANGQNREIAEDPEEPYAYCPSNPKSYALLFDIYDEAIRLFHPRVFHIGHDEVTNKGRFPHDEVCSAKGLDRLFADDVARLTEFLHARGARPMLWGDMLLHATEAPDSANAASPEAARELRSLLPKEAMIADWHYAGVTEYPSLALFTATGREVVVAGWWNPLNVAYLARAARAAGARGLLQTTWTGRFPTEKVLATEARQYEAILLAAEYAWSGRTDLPEEWDYSPGEQFARAWAAAPADNTVRAGVLINLDRVAGLSVAAGVGGDGWMGLGADNDLSALPHGRVRLADTLFRLPHGKVLSVGGRLGPAIAGAPVEIGVERRVGEVALLNATGWRVPVGTRVARMVVTYADGASEPVELVAGRTTAAWTEPGRSAAAPVAWRGRTRAGNPVSLRVTRWCNPRSDTQIRSLRFEASDAEAAWTLFGLTLLDPEPATDGKG